MGQCVRALIYSSEAVIIETSFAQQLSISMSMSMSSISTHYSSAFNNFG